MTDEVRNEPRTSSNEMTLLGEQLRELREAQKLSYDDVDKIIHIRPHIIETIESGQISESMAPVYARGFVKTYCEFLCAHDLWMKYNQHLSKHDTTQKAVDSIKISSGISHPTPIFRRASMLWVYIILITALLGAGFLIWKQYSDPSSSGDGFFLKITGEPPLLSQDHKPTGDETLQIASLDTAVSVDSTKNVSPPAHSTDISIDRQSGSIDLSWMNDGKTKHVVSQSVSASKPAVVDSSLLIEITGQKNRLMVVQKNKMVTQRTLNKGARRSYKVNSDTVVTLSAGNRANITWQGVKYESVGSDEDKLSLIFRADGTAAVQTGNSPHFVSEPKSVE